MSKKNINLQEVKLAVPLQNHSTAFDLLSPDLFCQKLEVMGVSKSTADWFLSFLSGRSQRVKIGSAASSRMETGIGSPQGSLLSPLIFIIFVSDLQDWLQSCDSLTYADDTSISFSGRSQEEVKNKLEKDAKNVLSYMASNRLVANAQKTTFLLSNPKREGRTASSSVRVGNESVQESSSEKLLGFTLSSDLSWKEHVHGKKGLLAQLNQRLYLISRLSSFVHREQLKVVADGLWTSKLRYGLAIFGSLRMSENDSKCKMGTELQIAQNKLLRLLTGSRLSDKKSVSSMLGQLGLSSVNQMIAEARLLETWKATHLPGAPLADILSKKLPGSSTTTRSISNSHLTIQGASLSFGNLASKLWNKAGPEIRNAITICTARGAIRKFARSMPI
jgi:ribonuclease P/MRP protein subunit RPP40